MREKDIKDKLEELKLESEKKAEILSDILEYNKSKSVEVFTESEGENIKMNEISPKNKKASVKKIATFILSSAAMLALVAGLVTLGQNNINKKSTGAQESNEAAVTTPIADSGDVQSKHNHYGMGVGLYYNSTYFKCVVRIITGEGVVVTEDESFENNMLLILNTENSTETEFEINGISVPVSLKISLTEHSKDETIFKLKAQSKYSLQEEDALIGKSNIPAKKLLYIENENGTGQRIIYYVFENKDSSKSNNVYLLEIKDYCNDINTSVFDKYWKEMISSIYFLDNNEQDSSEQETVLDDETLMKNIVEVIYSEETDKFLFYLGNDKSESETAPIGNDGNGGVDFVVSVDAKKVYDSNKNPITDIDYIQSINKDSNLMARVKYDGLIMETYPAQVNAYTIIIIEKRE